MTRSHADAPPPRTLLLATDNKNSILAEIDGGKLNPVAYSAYGQQSAQDSVATRLGFNGALRESHIGWYLLGNGYRAYNPTLMRFHSPDSWSPFRGGGLNAYMYCVGDPVNFSDPTGHVRLFPGIPKAVTRPVSNVVNFLFGGSSVTGPKRLSDVDQAAKQLGGLQGAEAQGVVSAMTGAGVLVAGSPGPSHGIPRQTSYNYGVSTDGGFTNSGAGFPASAGPRKNPNLLAPPDRVSTRVNQTTITDTYSDGTTKTRRREPVRGGGCVPSKQAQAPDPAPSTRPERRLSNGVRVVIDNSDKERIILPPPLTIVKGHDSQQRVILGRLPNTASHIRQP